ncbi:dihydrofolate reductase family protein [Luteipulveratus halotolerans]|uniref:dihydrofolate reductase family protein n=1 Tax=Luteipulveratus halotolerans TaxID=1631356 RepID=UPI001E40CAFE|nr:dihydrofolate reductase family protein [Luteipulveratus halotolerans]
MSDADLIALYDTPGSSETLVRLNMVSTLDGSGVGADGRSGSINTPADNAVFALLRAWSDVVLVGAGTARAEKYEPAVTDQRWSSLRRGRAAHPAILVVTGRGRVPDLLRPREGGDVLLATTTLADDAAVRRSEDELGAHNVVRAGRDSVDLADVVARLAERGLRRVLCEGGPSLAADLIGNDLVDELCLTWSPLVVGGDGTRILNGDNVSGRGALASLLHEDGSLIGRWDLRRNG